ncbi:GIY-YIG nuclease family protein [Antrihabitans spumae]|jgi:hypothetical protein|uniref:GIY-YIG nuclease family protein n=1 Tax=Antrihabitans spumae TaxID=3373370 RepID=A0ABW7KPS9_9NOCA
MGESSSATPDVDALIEELHGPPVRSVDASLRVPAASGLYAWWAEPVTFESLAGPPNGRDSSMRLLYIGLASTLRRRIVSNHLKRSGSSTLRRTLAGLLLDSEQYKTMWTDRVVLSPQDEHRLTTWMHNHLALTWCAHPDPAAVERTIIEILRPPLNVDFASGPNLAAIKKARAAYTESAGRKPL